MRADRRIDPDINLESDEQMDRLERLIANAVAAKVNVTGYRESEGGVRGWIVGIGTTLITSFILGAWYQSEEMAGLKQEVVDLRAQVEKLERLVEPRYRGSP
jgi:hypothetical protein